MFVLFLVFFSSVSSHSSGPTVSSHIDQVSGDIFDKSNDPTPNYFFFFFCGFHETARIVFAHILMGPRFVVMIFFSIFNHLIYYYEMFAENDDNDDFVANCRMNATGQYSRIFCKTIKLNLIISLCNVNQKGR